MFNNRIWEDLIVNNINTSYKDELNFSRSAIMKKDFNTWIGKR